LIIFSCSSSWNLFEKPNGKCPRLYPPSNLPENIKEFLTEKVEDYKLRYSIKYKPRDVYPSLKGSLTTNSIHDKIKPLILKSTTAWSRQEVEKMIAERCLFSVVCRGSVYAARDYIQFFIIWNKYANDNPWVLRHIDPYFWSRIRLVVPLVLRMIPAVAAYDPIPGIGGPMAINGSNHAWFLNNANDCVILVNFIRSSKYLRRFVN